jgi:hypothetical protein
MTTLSQRQEQELLNRRVEIMEAVQPGDGGDALDILYAAFGEVVTLQAMNYYRQTWNKRVKGQVGPNEIKYLYAFDQARRLRQAVQDLRREMVGI